RLLPVDESPTARPIRFGVALPAEWNGRSMQMGGGGMNGTIPPLAGGPAGPSSLSNGFVTYGSDSGHGAGDDEWTLNDEAIRNLGFMQMKKTHDAAMVLIERAYGRPPAYNYYVGGSQGGREGQMVVQRYPEDYDGVLSTVPIVGFSTLMLAPTLIRIQEIPLENWVPPTKGNAILAEFMRRCDHLDGLVDGIINNYVDCRAIFNVNDGIGEADPWAARRRPADRGGAAVRRHRHGGRGRLPGAAGRRAFHRRALRRSGGRSRRRAGVLRARLDRRERLHHAGHRRESARLRRRPVPRAARADRGLARYGDTG